MKKVLKVALTPVGVMSAPAKKITPETIVKHVRYVDILVIVNCRSFINTSILLNTNAKVNVSRACL